MPLEDSPLRARLSNIHSLLLAGEMPDPDDAVLACVAVQQLIVKLSRPAAKAVRKKMRQRRAELLRQLAAEHYADIQQRRPKARAIQAALRAYRDGEWRHHQAATTCPPAIEGTARGLMWRMFRLSSTFPDSESTIFNALTGA